LWFISQTVRRAFQASLVFEQGWGRGSDSFKADPPNATLSILAEGADNNVVVELSDPNVDTEEGKISFKVKVLDGELPETFGHASLFIDFHFGPSPADG